MAKAVLLSFGVVYKTAYKAKKIWLEKSNLIGRSLVWFTKMFAKLKVSVL